MKTLTYISKYHFIQIASLLIMLMWQVNVQAQADSTATYTYYDTTMTFNLNEIRASLLENTDLSQGEVEATLQYEPFWRSVFKSAMSNSSGNAERVIGMNDECTDVETNGCIGFENIITDGDNITGVFPWCTQSSCVRHGNLYDGDKEVLEFESVTWQGGEEDCGHFVPGFEVSHNPFEIIPSVALSYDPDVYLNGVAEVLELNAPSGKDFIRIGDKIGGFHAHRIVGKFVVDGANPILKYNYALAIQDTESSETAHAGNTVLNTQKPYFTIKFKTFNETTELWEDIRCGTYAVVGTASQNPDFETTGITVGQYVDQGDPAQLFNGMVLDWQQNVINLAQYAGEEVMVEATMTECTHGGHTGWAYLDIEECAAEKFEVVKEGDGCTYNFSTEYTGNYGGQGNETYEWNFGDGTTSTSPNPSHVYSEPGDYNVTLTISYCNFPNGNGGCISDCTSCNPDCTADCDGDPDQTHETVAQRCDVTFTETITICCDYCASDFAPQPGSEYVISAWVKEDIPNVRTYDSPNITLQFEGVSTMEGPFKPSGAIIDGWQRIEAVFDVPVEAEKIKVQLNNSGNNDVFFDDVRIHPFDASMKSFVYDPVTLRLSAELDERNYATYYEYDEEGALIRIKKETERGIMTIQEARNGIQKVND